MTQSADTASAPRPPLPPFTRETAPQKVRLAENAWNSRDPEKVSLAYTPDSRWRNRDEFPRGREKIVAFLTREWRREQDYRLIKELWSHTDPDWTLSVLSALSFFVAVCVFGITPEPGAFAIPARARVDPGGVRDAVAAASARAYPC